VKTHGINKDEGSKSSRKSMQKSKNGFETLPETREPAVALSKNQKREKGLGENSGKRRTAGTSGGGGGGGAKVVGLHRGKGNGPVTRGFKEKADGPNGIRHLWGGGGGELQFGMELRKPRLQASPEKKKGLGEPLGGFVFLGTQG